LHFFNNEINILSKKRYSFFDKIAKGGKKSVPLGGCFFALFLQNRAIRRLVRAIRRLWVVPLGGYFAEKPVIFQVVAKVLERVLSERFEEKDSSFKKKDATGAEESPSSRFLNLRFFSG